MNTKRSYLDTLNTGRQRRPDPTFDDLDRTLANLEGKLQRSQGPKRNESRRAAPQDNWTQRRAEPAFPPRPDLKTLARDIERTRRQEDGLSSMTRIASELKAMREELRQQMNQGLKREFDALRHDIQRLHATAPIASGGELGAEFERLSDAVRSLAERSDDRSVNMLRLELEQVKGALDTLAREDTLKSVDRRWDEFDRRWSSLEGRLDASSAPNIKALNQQLEQISRTVSNLPESLSVRSLDDRVRALAGSVEQFAHQYGSTMPGAFSLIEQRLDEISRAIAASGPGAQPVSFDPEPFQRIEARVASLARQIEELTEEQGSSQVIDRLNLLSQRVDEIAQRVEIPETIVGRLADQIALISDRLENDPGPAYSGAVFQGLEDRFEQLSQILERRQGDAAEQGHQLFRELERRLEEMADRMDRAPLAAGDGLALQGLENRLEDISRRLEHSAQQATGMDLDVVRNLETQVSALSAHLAKPSQPLPEFEDIAPRLNSLEQSLASNREAILDAARTAARDAIGAMSQSQTDSVAVAGLASELRALDALARRSDERNAKTFEAIHDTLLKIVDRLGTLEQGGVFPDAGRARSGPTPSLDLDNDAELFGARSFEGRGGAVSANTRSPAEAAAAAASHALGGNADEAGEPAGARRSMLGGLTRAFRKDREPAPTPAANEKTVRAPEPRLDDPIDPKLANQPLEPGSGAPDLNAIIRRVRDERGAGNPEIAKSDFIAAARRAAQAAAAEAQSTKRHSESAAGSSKLKFGDIFKARRKTMLLAATAIIVVLAGMQLGSAFLSDDGDMPAEVASIEPSQPLTAEAMSDSTDQREDEEAPADVRVAGDNVRPEEMAAEPGAPRTPDEPVAMEEAEEPAAATIAAAEPAPANPIAPARVAEPDPVETSTAGYEPAPEEAGPLALREAADGGDPKAMFEIGSRYAEGRGVAADMAKSAVWYEHAAELGYAPAQYRLGNFYEKGTGVERDVAKAKTWYEKAAKQGNASAMHNLAVLYAMGADGKADNDAAARWFLEAAELGVKDSQYNLGILAAKGAGVPQSLEESYKWFDLVARTGDRDAAAKRDEVAKAMRPEQLTKARGAAELWKARDVDPETNMVDIPEEWTETGPATASIDMKQAVRNIQAILNKNGYDAGPADGVMGQKTKNAIIAFQADNGMTADGQVTEGLVKALLERK
jgi:localization factor PodJL